MNTERFAIFSFLAVVLTTLVKLIFITNLNIDNVILVYVMWLLVALISIACARRLGIISYLEAIFVLGVWLLFELFLDLLLISSLAGNEVYHHLYLWISYLVMMVVVFLFHKKRHVEVRKIQRARQQPAKHH